MPVVESRRIVPVAPEVAFAISQTQGAVRKRWDPFIAHQHLMGGATEPAKGVRTFTLTPNADGSTVFSMKEEFSGLMLPMIKGSLPDFAPVFEAYAEDLKRAAESSA